MMTQMGPHVDIWMGPIEEENPDFPPPSFNFLLQENLFLILQENLFPILLEP